MLSRSRTTARTIVARSAVAGAVIAAPLAAGAVTPAAAEVPIGWEEASAMSGLDVLLIFVGIPLAIVLVLVVFGYVLARRTTPSYLPYVAAPGEAITAGNDRAELPAHH
ncbi:hypothetical protein FE697_019820 [Mumia zhuanghuii]|uniref:Uncharacterized protein n=2 Tax=Mumia TaxID=1546255 RepID=A0ABW1QQS1_9ACTN|nr:MULTISPECIES: hypothetical protein [Mumia]KAA1418101.1 hypothetical protein FE697_019820 [Mumia zhuanghuii]